MSNTGGASYVWKKEEKRRTGYFSGELVSKLPDTGICGGERHLLLFLSVGSSGDGEFLHEKLLDL